MVITRGGPRSLTMSVRPLPAPRVLACRPKRCWAAGDGFGEDYQRSGNVLLDELLGGRIVAHLPGGTDMQQAMEEYAATLREQDTIRTSFPAAALTPSARWGYVACAEELLYPVISATSASTMWFTPRAAPVLRRGLVAGFTATNSHVPVLGISVRAPGEAGRERLEPGVENPQSAGRGGQVAAAREWPIAITSARATVCPPRERWKR